MSSRPSSRGSARERKRHRGRAAAATLRSAAWLLLAVGFVCGFLAARLVVRLDRVVVARFEGQLFRVPSRVLSAPAILYPGLDWKHVDLGGTLVRLGYREAGADDPVEAGRYRWRRGEVRVGLRAFDHPSRPEPARDIRIRLEGSRIERIDDARTGRELGAVLLEPEMLGSYYGPDREQRELVRIEDVPAHLVDAVLAVEDQRFRGHVGVDPLRILGALWANVRAREIRQGGSTLTQQLVKNFFLTPERSLERKTQEAVMALLVEARYDKDRILEAYLNEIYLGQRGSTEVHGVGEAARFYFGRPVRDLGVAESALLAAIIQSPNGIAPHRAPEAARKRRDLVLALMHEQGRLDDAGLVEAQEEPLGLAAITPEPREARYFLDALRRQLPDYYDADLLVSEGLRIYSTLDLRLQKLAASALHEGLADLEKRFPKLVRKGPGKVLQGCLVALRPQTGEVLALVGGRSYGESQFDRCTQARRQAGSVFKPIVYAAALEPRDAGPALTLADRLEDAPLRVRTPSGPWEPANFDREFHGSVSVRQALEASLNVATARLGQQVGIERVVDLAHRLGIESTLPEVPSVAIGSGDVTPIELARAYATLANGGIRPEIRTFEDVVDREAHALERQAVRFERVLDAGTAFLVTSLLEGVVERGTGQGVRAAGIRGPVAAKTGTSNDERDAWFVGFTPELVVVVWVGFDDSRSTGLPASQLALPVWARFVREATGGQVRGAFLPPPEVVSVAVDPESGARALAGCPARQPEWFLAGTEPLRVCPPGAVSPEDGVEAPRRLLERLFDTWFGDDGSEL